MPIPTPEQINQYESFSGSIASAIEGVSGAQFHFIPAIGEWSIHEIVIHLADSEAVGFWRVRRTLAEKHAMLASYDEEAWARNLSYRIQDRELALQLFTSLRASNASLFRLVPAEAWERTAIHEERGELSVYDLFTTYVEHGKAHLEQLERLTNQFAERS